MRFLLVQDWLSSEGPGKMSEDRKREDSDSVVSGGIRLSLIKIGLLLLWAGFWLLLILLNAASPWWALLILALPLSFVSEWAGERVFASKYGWSTEQVGFSPWRIAFAVLLALTLSVGLYLMWKFFN